MINMFKSRYLQLDQAAVVNKSKFISTNAGLGKLSDLSETDIGFSCSGKNENGTDSFVPFDELHSKVEIVEHPVKTEDFDIFTDENNLSEQSTNDERDSFNFVADSNYMRMRNEFDLNQELLDLMLINLYKEIKVSLDDQSSCSNNKLNNLLDSTPLLVEDPFQKHTSSGFWDHTYAKTLENGTLSVSDISQSTNSNSLSKFDSKVEAAGSVSNNKEYISLQIPPVEKNSVEQLEKNTSIYYFNNFNIDVDKTNPQKVVVKEEPEDDNKIEIDEIALAEEIILYNHSLEELEKMEESRQSLNQLKELVVKVSRQSFKKLQKTKKQRDISCTNHNSELFEDEIEIAENCSRDKNENDLNNVGRQGKTNIFEQNRTYLKELSVKIDRLPFNIIEKVRDELEEDAPDRNCDGNVFENNNLEEVKNTLCEENLGNFEEKKNIKVLQHSENELNSLLAVKIDRLSFKTFQKELDLQDLPDEDYDVELFKNDEKEIAENYLREENENFKKRKKIKALQKNLNILKELKVKVDKLSFDAFQKVQELGNVSSEDHNKNEKEDNDFLNNFEKRKKINIPKQIGNTFKELVVKLDRMPCTKFQKEKLEAFSAKTCNGSKVLENNGIVTLDHNLREDNDYNLESFIEESKGKVNYSANTFSNDRNVLFKIEENKMKTGNNGCIYTEKSTPENASDSKHLFQCNRCSYKAVDKFNLMEHSKIHGNSNQSSEINCKIPSEESKHLQSQHLSILKAGDVVAKTKKVITRKVNFCDMCNFQTVYRSNFRRHLRKMHKKTISKNNNENNLTSIYKTTNKTPLVKRVQIEIKKVPSQCQICNKLYDSKEKLDSHIVALHSKNEAIMSTVSLKVFSCDLCNYKTVHINIFERHKMMRHIQKRERVKPVKRFQCDICDYKAACKTRLEIHKRVHFGTQPYQCLECKKKFNHKQILDGHILYKHSNKTEMINSVTSKIHTCNICGYKTTKSSHLHSHMQKHICKIEEHSVAQKIYSCDKCNYETGSPLYLERHLKAHKLKDVGKQYQCDICGYKTIHKGYLGTHIRSHSENLPYLCQECNKRFNLKPGLDSHIVKKHAKNKKMMDTVTSTVYECKTCEYKSCNKETFEVHLQTHTGAKKHKIYQCYKCDYKTIHRVSIKKHIDVHTGNRPFHCTKCDKRSITKKDLDCHIIKNHPNDEEIMKTITCKIFYCDRCDYKTGQWGHFKYHVERHKGAKADKKYKCNICDYKTIDKGALTKHTQVHTGDYAYSCSKCDKKFSSKQHIDFHILTKHSKDKEMMKNVTSKFYGCDYCTFKTTTSDRIKSHLERLHDVY